MKIDLFSILNTIILAIIFFYQKNRNRVLEDQLNSQKQLITETKSVVTQQATALEGQAKVVDTALKYTNAFDISKLESVIRREISADYREEIENLRKSSAVSPEKMEELIDKAAKAAADALAEVVGPLLPFVLRDLAKTPKPKREAALAKIQPPELRQKLQDAVESLDQKLKEYGIS